MIKKLLVANRGEIAIRVFRTATQMGMSTAAVFTYEDRFSLHRFKADEAWQVGEKGSPVKAYLDIENIVSIAKRIGADAIHPGYGFLSENVEFAQACADNGILFVGPTTDTLKIAGDKDLMREVASKSGVPVVPGTDKVRDAKQAASKIGYPLIIKATAGGGGRGMRIVRSESELQGAFEEAQSEAGVAFGVKDVIFEKLVENPRHIEVQLLGDGKGNVVHLFERDCSVQRRHQKIIELSPALNLDTKKLFDYALSLGKALNLRSAATAEFLVSENGEVYFIEVNPRIQVEHTVTEEVTGIDIVEKQLQVAQDGALPLSQKDITHSGAAIQCRITTEDPAKNFQPTYGRLTTYRSVGGFGVRLDAGSAYTGSEILPFYDSLLVKVTTRGQNLKEAGARMKRSLSEFRVRGVPTNVGFLKNVLEREELYTGKINVNFLAQTPELFNIPKVRNRANRLLQFIAEVTINGHENMPGISGPETYSYPKLPEATVKPGLRDVLLKEGKGAFLKKVRNSEELLFTDTTFRDAHQSLFATRLRTHDILKIAPLVAERMSGLFSLEMWGGATFDVMMRFLKEDPWERLTELRKAIPNIPFQMLFRGTNAVGYTSYDDKVVKEFVKVASESGIDIFRIFDSLNNTDRMELAIRETLECGAIAESSICYTGDVLTDDKYNLDYYLRKADELVKLGSDILAIKDMAGLLKPYSANFLISELRKRFDTPIHFHTHDTAGVQTASYLEASKAGVDIVDCALGPMSGLTSQPPLESLVNSLTERKSSLKFTDLTPLSQYWEHVQGLYECFSSGLHSPTGEVYEHEMPGGQYSNLRAQSIALGKGDEWPIIKKRYREVDHLFGRLTKVTPSSKVVGDLALYLSAKKITAEDLLQEPEKHELPESVKSFLSGGLGQPEGGFPERVLKAFSIKQDVEPPKPYEELQKEFVKKFGYEPNDKELLSYCLYPKVFTDYKRDLERFGNLNNLSSKVFFFGMKEGEELVHDLEPGKRLFIKLIAISDAGSKRSCFFELNGQSREFIVTSSDAKVEARKKADPGNSGQVGSPYSGVISEVEVKVGDKVKTGDLLASLEAMKMQTRITAAVSGEVKSVLVSGLDRVEAGDLLFEIG